MEPTLARTDDGFGYRDLNHNGRLDPYEDSRLPTAARVEDLLERLSLPEKVGLMFHTVIEAGPDGAVLEAPGRISKSPTSSVVLSKHLNHFNVHVLNDARSAARWSNNLQRLAEQTPHGIPVTVSTDPRHSFIENSGVSFAASMMSQWPEPLGLAALADDDRVRRFAEIVNAEYRAVGIRAALHPTLDLATEPRWGRQAGTFGSDPDTVTRLTLAYLEGLQRGPVGIESVACTAKHFPGGGPQAGGEDAHFPYGKDQVYPGGRFADHLAPFLPAIRAGVAAIMPYYGRPIGLSIHGEPVEEVGFGYNRLIVTGLLREQLGYDGVVLTDWELVMDNHVGDQVLPARAWGVEQLDAAERMQLILTAGCDQFGGEECVEVLLELVGSGRVDESRIDVSARRLLTVKFDLGLFDDPFVDEDVAAAVLAQPAFVDEGHRAQAESVTVLTTSGLLPLPQWLAVYAEGLTDDALEGRFVRVERPDQAEVALIRLQAPFEPRDELFLEAWFHQGHLDFQPGLPVRLARIAAQCPLVIDIALDRPAVLTPLLEVASALTVSYGSSGAAWLDAVTARIPPRGRLPFDLPRSMAQVREHSEDVPGFGDPLFAQGWGLRIDSERLDGVKDGVS
ncbi:MAG: glycoside hydrolase family 3 protein [Micropruina sp.]|nr:glycoside hydrolase family 3 protein [Micropruina sp.]